MYATVCLLSNYDKLQVLDHTADDRPQLKSAAHRPTPPTSPASIFRTAVYLHFFCIPLLISSATSLLCCSSICTRLAPCIRVQSHLSYACMRWPCPVSSSAEDIYGSLSREYLIFSLLNSHKIDKYHKSAVTMSTRPKMRLHRSCQDT